MCRHQPFLLKTSDSWLFDPKPMNFWNSAPTLLLWILQKLTQIPSLLVKEKAQIDSNLSNNKSKYPNLWKSLIQVYWKTVKKTIQDQEEVFRLFVVKTIKISEDYIGSFIPKMRDTYFTVRDVHKNFREMAYSYNPLNRIQFHKWITKVKELQRKNVLKDTLYDKEITL